MEISYPRPSQWLSEHFYIPEPRDPDTGDFYGPGPIILSETQARILDEALSRDARNRLKYSTIIYSTIKKSGKSTLASGAGLFMMEHTPYGQGYCLANDGKQSEDILYKPIWTCIDLHHKLGGIYKKVKANKDSVQLPNRSMIGALPCDTAGNAGKEPTISLMSEIWGYTTEVKRKLFGEMTVPITRYGRALRWIETYAGYKGQSDLLWDLYVKAVKQGIPHPDFLDLSSGGEPVVWINPSAGIFCYWDHEPRMAWQMGEEGEKYYQEEAQVLIPGEFRRLHKNEWVSPTGAYLDAPEQWDACADRSLPALQPREPVVIALDAAETNDCASILAVSRHPLRPDTDIAVRACRIFQPPPGGAIHLESTLGKTLLSWCLGMNVMVVAYDKYQLTKMVQDYSRGNVIFSNEELMQMLRDFGEDPKSVEEAIDRYRRAVQVWYYKYSQQTERNVSDKFLYDLIVHRRLAWDPTDLNYDIAPRGDQETLTKQIKHAGSDDSKSKRLIKLADSLKIDAPVTLSMASELCLRLNISEPVASPGELLQQYNKHEISYDEYLRRVAESMKKNGAI